MDSNVVLLFAVPFIIFLSPYLSRLFRIPTITVEIILGAILGYTGFVGENHFFELSAEIGFIFLMFLAGLEVEFHKILGIKKNLIRPTILYITLVHIVSFLFIAIFALPLIFITILPLVSIGLIVTLSKEYGGDFEWIKLAFIVGTFAEVISIIEFSLFSNVMVSGFGVELFSQLGMLFLFIVGSFFLYKFIGLLIWWFPEAIEKITPTIDNQEKDIRFSMVVLVGTCALMIWLHLEIAFGAFIAGMFMRAFFLVQEDLVHKLEGFGFGFLVPIFFIHTGISFDLGALQDVEMIKMAFLISFSMIVTRLFASFSFRKFLSLKDIALFGFSHSMPLSLLVALISLAYSSGRLSMFYYNAFILAAIIEVLIATGFIRMILLYKKPSTNNENKR